MKFGKAAGFTMSKRSVMACILGCVCALGLAEEPIRIGVLANRGVEVCHQEWDATADYLSERLAPRRFRIVPLSFGEIIPAVRSGGLAYLSVNPAYYAQLEHEGWGRRIATLQLPGLYGPEALFGGVIFARADRTDIVVLGDLRGRSFAAVNASSFGGWQAAWGELLLQGIRPVRDFKTLTFSGTHDAVVYAVVSGTVDAGTVRTTQLERMAKEGLVDLAELRVLNAYGVRYPDYPFLLSTPLYPEWPFIALHTVDPALSKQVAIALLELSEDHPAAMAMHAAGWAILQDYTAVHDLLRLLKIAPYDKIERVGLAQIFRQYWPAFIATLVFVVLLLLLAWYLASLNRRLKLAAVQAAALTEAANAASRAKSEFLANMSHEIRTPLNGVIGFTELLLKTPLNPTQRTYAQNASLSGSGLLGIINDILDFSKIEAGKLELEIQRTDLVSLVEECIDIIKFQAESKQLELLLSIDPAMPRYADVDPLRLRQILINLLGNAVKFTDHGEVELRVGFCPGSGLEGSGGGGGSGGGEACGDCEEPVETAASPALFGDSLPGTCCYTFSIRDTGIGIAPEQQQRLFKAFSQADPSTTRRFGGTGLGLVISNLLAVKMGSAIQLVSQPGMGSTFSFDLATSCAHEYRLDVEPRLLVQRVLIVDDNANNRLILERNLDFWGIRFRSNENGFAALQLLQHDKAFDLAIIDYHMPGMDGLELIQRIREQLGLTAQLLPVLLLHSSITDEDLKLRCSELGVARTATKPIKSGELYGLLGGLSPQPDAAAGTARSESSTVVSFARQTILVAEDVEMNSMLLGFMLKRLLPGARVVLAKNGLEAVRLYEQQQPDLVLMDIHMPLMDGIEASRKIRHFDTQAGRHTPIIALTAGVSKEEADRCHAADIDAFLAKPLREAALAEVLQRFIDSSNAAYLIAACDNFEAGTHFDLTAFEARVSDPEISRQIVQMAAQEIPRFVACLEEFATQQDWNGFRQQAHTLKGIGLNLSCCQLAELAEQAEAAAKNDLPDPQTVASLVAALRAEWQAIEPLLAGAK